ncbi:hypothetical protein MLD38_040150 [Melastoma candidum]|uniref:Uncharacterized protein n=1 Tax=Melastoma candidum TaxID=119954 RepID=A0ACB9L564_9MYRT|nr:hypothetical protein MLD38_040150 [Melastoma candidum]
MWEVKLVLMLRKAEEDVGSEAGVDAEEVKRVCRYVVRMNIGLGLLRVGLNSLCKWWPSKPFRLVRSGLAGTSGKSGAFVGNKDRETINSSVGPYVADKVVESRISPAFPIGGSASVGRRRLTQEEVDERRLKGLCFTCNEPFNRNHKCSKKQLYSLIVEPMEDSVLDDEVQLPEADRTRDGMGTSIYALNGEIGGGDTRTMQVRGNYKKRPLHILVDSGSTHNFLDSRIVGGINVVIKAITPVTVAVADGRSVLCNRMIPQLTWAIQGIEFQADFYVLALGGCEMILGVDWLSQLGDITWNFKLSTMKFWWKTESVVLQGICEQNTIAQLHMIAFHALLCCC